MWHLQGSTECINWIAPQPRLKLPAAAAPMQKKIQSPHRDPQGPARTGPTSRPSFTQDALAPLSRHMPSPALPQGLRSVPSAPPSSSFFWVTCRHQRPSQTLPTSTATDYRSPPPLAAVSSWASSLRDTTPSFYVLLYSLPFPGEKVTFTPVSSMTKTMPCTQKVLNKYVWNAGVIFSTPLADSSISPPWPHLSGGTHPIAQITHMWHTCTQMCTNVHTHTHLPADPSPLPSFTSPVCTFDPLELSRLRTAVFPSLPLPSSGQSPVCMPVCCGRVGGKLSLWASPSPPAPAVSQETRVPHEHSTPTSP